jgi:hypothetical protein
MSIHNDSASGMSEILKLGKAAGLHFVYLKDSMILNIFLLHSVSYSANSPSVSQSTFCEYRLNTCGHVNAWLS